jgi:hypothetical protein
MLLSPLSHRLGLTLGLFFGLVHLLWTLLVWVGWAQGLVNWKMAMHGVGMSFQVMSLSPLRGIVLIILAGVVGYVVGAVLGFIYEKVQK